MTQVRVLAIDPGTTVSAWLDYQRDTFGVWTVGQFGIDRNEDLLGLLRAGFAPGFVVLERIESFGMPVGRDVFETVLWTGRFDEACYPRQVDYVTRRLVKTHLCGSAKAKDANVRTALIDRFGGQEKAVGRKAAPGPLHGISKDVWSALAIAVTYVDTKESR